MMIQYRLVWNYDGFFFFRLSAALTGGKAIVMINAACSEKGLLDLYRVELIQQSQKTSDLQNSAKKKNTALLQSYQTLLIFPIADPWSKH